MKATTNANPMGAIKAYETIEYSPGVFYCYGDNISGKHMLVAIVHETVGGYVVDAEADVMAMIPGATPTVTEPHRLHDILVKAAVGKNPPRITHAVAPLPSGDTYHGHRILDTTPSSHTWEELRKREYQIPLPKPSDLTPVHMPGPRIR